MTNDEPRWLNDGERQAWAPFVGVLIKLPSALDSAMRRSTGLSHFEYVVMSAMSEATDRTLPMGELAEFTNASLPRLSHVVAKLEQRGWVQRVGCPTNGRITNAVLTDSGMAVVVETAPKHLDAVRALVIDALEPRQLAELAAIAGRLLARLNVDAAVTNRV